MNLTHAHCTPPNLKGENVISNESASATRCLVAFLKVSRSFFFNSPYLLIIKLFFRKVQRTFSIGEAWMHACLHNFVAQMENAPKNIWKNACDWAEIICENWMYFHGLKMAHFNREKSESCSGKRKSCSEKWNNIQKDGNNIQKKGICSEIFCGTVCSVCLWHVFRLYRKIQQAKRSITYYR